MQVSDQGETCDGTRPFHWREGKSISGRLKLHRLKITSIDLSHLHCNSARDCLRCCNPSTKSHWSLSDENRKNVMGKDKVAILRKNILKYEKGEQIVKQGDYGISIYKILKGKVEIFRASRGVKVPLATLETGSIIGEMIFLSRKAEVRSASVRALEETELQVLHPHDLKLKYEQISPVLKEILKQALSRLVRMNRFIDQLAVYKKKSKKKGKESDDYWESKRRFYRKPVDLECKYVPPDRRKDFFSFLKGRIKDSSMSGCFAVSAG